MPARSSSAAEDKLMSLRTSYTTLTRQTLPQLARTRSSVQKYWPVALDHCFARIILDNAVGVDKPWPEVVAKPATNNMTETQLRNAVQLGEAIANGDADLDVLNQISLGLRGKLKVAQSNGESTINTGSKRKAEPKSDAETVDEAAEDARAPKTRKGEVGFIWAGFTGKSTNETDTLSQPNSKRQKQIPDDPETMNAARQKIAADSSLTDFRKRVLTLLTQVPRGQYTTYKALADAAARLDKGLATSMRTASRNEQTGSARAVGSAMRNNPFAPTVPCHRVLAADGKLGGFKGDWGEEGKFAHEKRRLLREEGVRFDGKGKVLGSPFVGFT